uniref:non-specific serine/threonine protein kinase n=1 Tax=Romanomermis culicivorax TaxID=13658 RepID=A0A915IG86_ROMCU
MLTVKSVTKVAAGDGFSVFCSDNGLIMTCGKKEYCGIKNLSEDLTKPKLVEKLLSVDILTVACGSKHTVAVAEGGKVYAWGDGGYGRLGTGSEENECGADGTVLISDSGTLFAMGSNKYNKIGLNKRRGFFSHTRERPRAGFIIETLDGLTEIEKALTPTPLRRSCCRVVDASLGAKHMAILLESGHVHTFGDNSKGQLGKGHTQNMHGCVAVNAMDDKTVVIYTRNVESQFLIV